MVRAVGPSTEVPVVDPSTAGLAVVAAAPAVHEAPRAVPERERGLLHEPVLGVPPVREERANVLAKLFAEGGHGFDGSAPRLGCLEGRPPDATMVQ